MGRSPSAGSRSSIGEHGRPPKEQSQIFLTFSEGTKIVLGYRSSLSLLSPWVSAAKILSIPQQRRPQWHRFSISVQFRPVSQRRGPPSARTIQRTSTLGHRGSSSLMVVCTVTRRSHISKTFRWRIFMYSYLGINIPTVRDASTGIVALLTIYRSLFNALGPQQQYLRLRYLAGRQVMPTVTLGGL